MADENSHTRVPGFASMSGPSLTLASVRSLLTARARAARGCPFPRTLPASVLAGFVAVVVCAVAAGELLRLGERSDGSTALDREITSWVVDHRTAGVTTVARSFSLLGSSKVLLPLVASVALALAWRRRFALASLLVVAWGGSIGLYNVTKLIVDRRRPPPGIRLATAAGSSFPSGHATQSLATYVALAAVTIAVLPRTRVLAWVLAVSLVAGVGWSRLYLGVHWATDVGAGWTIAGLWIALLVRLSPVAPPAITDDGLTLPVAP
jgi:membrane-associated phospholipid phosphatase